MHEAAPVVAADLLVRVDTDEFAIGAVDELAAFRPVDPEQHGRAFGESGKPLLALAQRGFDTAPLRHVAHGADDAHEAVTLEDREAGAADPAALAIAARDTKLHGVTARAVRRGRVGHGALDTSSV